MTTSDQPRRRAIEIARRRLGPVARRLGMTPEQLAGLVRHRGQVAAQIEQVTRAQERLEAYLDRVLEQNDARLADAEDVLAAARSVRDSLGAPEGGTGTGPALTRRLDEAMLHAEARAAEARTAFARELADLRSTIRLSQALVEQVLAGPEEEGAPPPPPREFEHAVPTMDLLYRSFEDLHRGDPESIIERQRDDYFELLTGLPNPELPIADLGCGRGELVNLLAARDIPAVGVDSNLGQVADSDSGRFDQDDLFSWLDRQDDGSHRAIVSMHVIEHLPTDLQIRMVFEARRVLADGGALVLETPNTLSLNIAASNFWVDPTHARPVHPLFLEFLAREAGFADIETRPLHPIPAEFPSTADTAPLVENLNSLILGAGDLALVARK